MTQSQTSYIAAQPAEKVHLIPPWMWGRAPAAGWRIALCGRLIASADCFLADATSRVWARGPRCAKCEGAR